MFIIKSCLVCRRLSLKVLDEQNESAKTLQTLTETRGCTDDG